MPVDRWRIVNRRAENDAGHRRARQDVGHVDGTEPPYRLLRALTDA